MIFAETERLRLRALRREDLPRYVELIGDWDVARWLSSVPYPYFMKHAEEFLARMETAYRAGTPELFLITDKVSGEMMGAVGLHPAKFTGQAEDRALAEVGYWLGRPYWGRGVMTEAVKAVLGLGFQRPELRLITAVTDPANHASQNVLRKAGLQYRGTEPCAKQTLRDREEITRWEARREAARPMLLVAAVALIDAEGRVLLAQRPAGKAMAGLWEFPGGKLQEGETPEQALVRELREELAITVAPEALTPLAFASHAYADFHLLMPLYACRVWQGTPQPMEGQSLVWAHPAQLSDYPMPPADLPLVEALRRRLA